jgi:hypothetical protein
MITLILILGGYTGHKTKQSVRASVSNYVLIYLHVSSPRLGVCTDAHLFRTKGVCQNRQHAESPIPPDLIDQGVQR